MAATDATKDMDERMQALRTHPFPPVVDGESRVLILGTMPSPASLRAGFYYGHPRNRFWRAMGDVFGATTPMTREERERFCHAHHIALWDVVERCLIRGADDSSIREPVVHPIQTLLNAAPIRAIFTNGQKAHTLYRRHVGARTGVDAIPLPSTSPANCRVGYDALLCAYRAILPYCAD
jgi:TDG/mug DNA glycosylase family protein